MSVEVTLGTPLADALHTSIQGKIAELEWAGPGAEGSAMSEYFLLMLANGKTETEIASEIAGDLLGLGSDDPTPPAFAKWLFEQIHSLGAQLGSGAAPSEDAAMEGIKDDSMDGAIDAAMDSMSDAPAANLNAYALLSFPDVAHQIPRYTDRLLDPPGPRPCEAATPAAAERSA